VRTGMCAVLASLIVPCHLSSTNSRGYTRDAKGAILILLKLNIHLTQLHLNDGGHLLVQLVAEPGPLTRVSHAPDTPVNSVCALTTIQPKHKANPLMTHRCSAGSKGRVSDRRFLPSLPGPNHRARVGACLFIQYIYPRRPREPLPHTSALPSSVRAAAWKDPDAIWRSDGIGVFRHTCLALTDPMYPQSRTKGHACKHVHTTRVHICMFREIVKEPVEFGAGGSERLIGERDQHILQVIALDGCSHMGGNGLIGLAFSRQHLIIHLHSYTIEAVPVDKPIFFKVYCRIIFLLFFAIFIDDNLFAIFIDFFAVFTVKRFQPSASEGGSASARASAGGCGAEAREGVDILWLCIKKSTCTLENKHTLTHASVLERKERKEGKGWRKERGEGKRNLTTGACVSGSTMSSMSLATVNSAPEREALWRPSKQYDVRHLHQSARPQQTTCLDMGIKGERGRD
jgi:hypothetical protein